MAMHLESSPLFHALTCGFLVQMSKVLTFLVREKKINVRRFVETGGMPSAHSAAVSSLTTAVGLQDGFGSTLFAVCLYFSLIVMYDAAGLRQAAGKQAVILNRLMDEHWKEGESDRHRLMELLGHTPLEVFVGAILGVASAFLWNWIQ
ncbi:MAG TPA: divergent PAP2 family protein [Candidatus Eisenbacteria bacterium]|nr:divergent PAP2 family protein [Candidatus Eisenbacteria bacterium]